MQSTKYKIVGIDNLNDYYDVNLKKKRLHILKKYKNFFFSKIDINDNSSLERIFKKNLSETFIKKLKISLPNEFLKKWILATNKDATEDQLNQEYDQYAKSLKWQLIENRIIKENNIKVESDEVVAKTKELLSSQYSQYGMMIPGDEELTKAAQNVLSNQEESRKIFDMMYDQKVITYLKENLKISEKYVSYDDFVKLASAQ